MSDEPRSTADLGALWEKSNHRGKFMTGVVNGVAVVVFPNLHKTSSKHPDWRILKARPKQEPLPERDDF